MTARQSLKSPRFAPLFLVSLGLVGTVGCADARTGRHATTPKTAARSVADPAVEYRRLMSRENGPFSKHHLQLFGGLATADYEAVAPSKPECTAADADGDSTCEVRLALGADQDGDADDILCLIDTTPRGPFGTVIAHRLDGAALVDLPQFSVAKVGEGVTVEFVADWVKHAEDVNTVGTLKVATFFSQGYSATCSDVRAGGRKTFARVVGDLFRSLKFAPNPRRPAFMTAAYDLRQGDRTYGFRYGLIEKRLGGKPGSAEVDFSFRLQTNGKSWNTMDTSLLVTRDANGAVDLYRRAFAGGDKTVAVLSAKPSEDRKFRLKVERGDKSDALESTPKAPLTTELWSAGEFAKVARGARPGYRYAVLGLDDSGEPAFKYISITRSSSDVLLEEEESDKGRDKGLAASLKDELYVTGDGSVTKEVSTDSISQRIFTWGKLPSNAAMAASQDGDRKAAKEVRANGKGKTR
jgi:hypothetical protein